MPLAVVAVVLGAAVLAWGAAAFTRNVRQAAAGLGVPVIGGVVLLVAAEPQAVVTAVVASGRAHPALAAGAALGTNLVILTLAVGSAVLLRPVPVSRRVLEYAVAAVVVGALAVVLLWDGVLSRADGVLLLVVYAVAVAWAWRRERNPPMVGVLAEADPTRRPPSGEMGRPLLLVLAALLAMIAGALLTVGGAQGLVGVHGVSESVIGPTVLGLATGAPTVALVWVARGRRLTEGALAGLVGAATANATVTLGLAGLVNPLVLGLHSPAAETGIVTAALPLVLFAGYRSGRLGRWLAAPLVVGYLATLWWLFAG